MNRETMWKIFQDTAYIRTSGTAEEKKCAEYLMAQCRSMGFEPQVETFTVPMSNMQHAELLVNGISIPCEGYRLCGSGTVEAPIVYLPNNDTWSLQGVKGKIVLVEGALRYWTYQDILTHGAVGYISYSGDANFVDCDIDKKELRPMLSKNGKLLGVHVNVKDAIEIARLDDPVGKITVKQEEYEGTSQNFVVDLPGEISDTIVLTAHYDSVPLSVGTYDNMSGAVGIMGVMDYFRTHSHRYSLRFVWCGSEERGLLGSKAYCAAHKDELDGIVLNINLDMIGSIMGEFQFYCSADEKLRHYTEYLAAQKGMGLATYFDLYSSDSTPFADCGVPAVSFARTATHNTAPIHNRFDTIKVMSPQNMEKDIAFVAAFTEQMACAQCLPVAREIPQHIKDRLDVYMSRKRPEKK